MKLTVKLDYACRALAQLAKRYGSGEVSRIEELARAEEIPAKFLAQILADLRNGGLVLSKRGKQGGYLLAKEPEAITLHDVIEVVEGDLFSTVADSAGESGERVSNVWNALQEKFEENARAYTLQDFANSPAEGMYYI